MQSVSEMAALERIDMLRQPIEIFRRANLSENTSLRGNVAIQWDTLCECINFILYCRSKVAPVFKVAVSAAT